MPLPHDEAYGYPRASSRPAATVARDPGLAGDGHGCTGRDGQVVALDELGERDRLRSRDLPVAAQLIGIAHVDDRRLGIVQQLVGELLPR